MRDPHVHAEKTLLPGFGNAAMRELIVRATGLDCDLPKTAGTGCGVRRPIAMTSTVPESITCLACREWAAAQLREEIASGDMLLAEDLAGMNDWHLQPAERLGITSQVEDDRALLARYEKIPRRPREQEKRS